MKCEMDYCIYNQNSKCRFTEVEINMLGMCETCIMVSLPQSDLAKYKREQLQNTTKAVLNSTTKNDDVSHCDKHAK